MKNNEKKVILRFLLDPIQVEDGNALFAVTQL